MSSFDFQCLCWCAQRFVDATPKDVQRGLTEPCDNPNCLLEALEASTKNKHAEDILRRPHVAKKLHAKRNHPRLKGRI